MFRVVCRKALLSTSQAHKSAICRAAYSTTKYTPDHEWLSIKGDVGVFGITDYAQKGKKRKERKGRKEGCRIEYYELNCTFGCKSNQIKSNVAYESGRDCVLKKRLHHDSAS